jgi:hypothetical protein
MHARSIEAGKDTLMSHTGSEPGKDTLVTHTGSEPGEDALVTHTGSETRRRCACDTHRK